MKKEHQALVSLFPTPCGGRKKPIYSGYNSNLVFGFPTNKLNELWKENKYFYDSSDSEKIRNTDAEINFENEYISPGEARLVILVLKGGREEYLGEELFKKDIMFIMREGGRVIGTGIIV